VSTPIKELKGITEAVVEALKAKSISDNEDLVEAAATPEKRKALASQCECNATLILALANRADLARVKGVSGVYSDLLEHAGVDTVKELATRRADNLHAKILETNLAQALTQRPPTLAQVEGWIAQAHDLPKVLSY
jgi:predicted flap endonuclease-1-like 5' DNA nuclease